VFEKEHERHEKFKAAQDSSSGAYYRRYVSSAGAKPTQKFEVDFARTFRTSSFKKILKGGLINAAFKLDKKTLSG
jgi:hypothetical protein